MWAFPNCGLLIHVCSNQMNKFVFVTITSTHVYSEAKDITMQLNNVTEQNIHVTKSVLRILAFFLNLQNSTFKYPYRSCEVLQFFPYRCRVELRVSNQSFNPKGGGGEWGFGMQFSLAQT
jgi:hypothetical protein